METNFFLENKIYKIKRLAREIIRYIGFKATLLNKIEQNNKINFERKNIK